MWTVIESPVGDLRLVVSEGPDGVGQALTAIEFSPFAPAAVRPTLGRRADDDPLLMLVRLQLAEYFSGVRTAFDLPLAPAGTPFQQAVWAELGKIGWGTTASYSEIAVRLGRTPAASRAVGLANGRNPIPIVIGCHRVIGANGSLTGYAGGMARKQRLLDLETDRGDVLF